MIGTDFLVKLGSSVNLSQLQATIGQDKTPISISKRSGKVEVNVIESLEIPACSEALPTGSITDIKGTVLVEPKHEVVSNDSLLYPARCIAQIVNNTIPIKIVNVNNFPVEIFAGTCVGMAETVNNSQIGSERKGESIPNTFLSNEWINSIDLSNCLVWPNKKNELLHLLASYNDIFVKTNQDFGRAHSFTHSIQEITLRSIKGHTGFHTVH